jgi:hypothetical protein
VKIKPASAKAKGKMHARRSPSPANSEAGEDSDVKSAEYIATPMQSNSIVKP